jgi:phospholipid/cholesterol/gamma-HCH transport system ATP-binding protein
MPESLANRDHIVVDHVTKRFGNNTVLREVSLTVTRSQIAVIIGGSGAGKTTLMRLLIGLDQPTSGAIYIDGVNIVGLPERRLNQVRHKFGMVFQHAALLDSLTVFDNVAFPLREHTKLGEKKIRGLVSEKLGLLELAGTEQRFPSELSGGMRKRVALARALMLNPEIVIYDEPTSGLDPVTSRLVDDLILTTRERFGVTSVVISHDMTGALKIADCIYLLSRGSIATSGTPEEFMSSEHELAAEFLRSSGVEVQR